VDYRLSTCGVQAIGLPSVPRDWSIRKFSPNVQGSWQRPSDTGAGGQSYPLLYYEIVASRSNGEVRTFTAPNSSVSYSSADLTYGFYYNVTMRAVNSAGAGPFSDSRRFRVSSLPPATVLTVSLPSHENGLCNFTLTFPDSEVTNTNTTLPVTGYEVVALPLSAFNPNGTACNEIATVRLNPATYFNVTLTGLTKGCEYSFGVYAINLAGTGPGSIETGLAQSLSSPPQLLSLNSTQSQVVDVSWSIPLDTGDFSANPDLLLFYIVEQANDPNFQYSLYMESYNVYGTTSISIPNLDWCSPFYFKIYPVTVIGVGPPSDVETITPFNCTRDIPTCPVNSYFSELLCRDCPRNSTSLPFSTSLLNCTCVPGFTGPNGGNCTACPAGTYKNSTGEADCVICPRDSYSTVAQAVCSSCPANSYSPNGSLTVLSCSCGRGYSGPDGGPCLACTPGSYKDVNGTAVCDTCRPDTYSGFGFDVCAPCPSHSFSPRGSSLVNCTCDIGFSGPGGGPCPPCRPGTYKDFNGSAACLLCPGDSYQDRNGSTTCTDCPAQTTSGNGSFTVTNCSCVSGWVGPNGGNCSRCVPGTYKPEVGSMACTLCPTDTYSTLEGAIEVSVCLDCPSNAISDPGAPNITDCKCRPGYFGPHGGPWCSICVGDTFADTKGTVVCSPCNNTQCPVGRWRGRCVPSHDAPCNLCTGAPLDAIFTSRATPFNANNCSWECVDGFRHSNGTCVDCNTPCPGGQYRDGCDCVPCSNWKPPESSFLDPEGSVITLSQCEWDCDVGSLEIPSDTCQQQCV